MSPSLAELAAHCRLMATAHPDKRPDWLAIAVEIDTYRGGRGLAEPANQLALVEHHALG